MDFGDFKTCAQLILRKRVYWVTVVVSCIGLWTVLLNNSFHNTETLVIVPNKTDSSSNEDEIEEEEVATITASNGTQNCSLSLAEFVIYFYVQTFICFVGFILNIINLAVFRKPQFSGAAYDYMTAMSVADALTLLNYMPVGLLRCTGYFPYCQNASFKAFRTAVFYYNAYVTFAVNNMSEAASVWFTVLLSVERYMAMRQLGGSFHTQKKKRFQTEGEKAQPVISRDYQSERSFSPHVGIQRQTPNVISNNATTTTATVNGTLGEKIRQMLRNLKCTHCIRHPWCPCRPRLPAFFRKLNVRYSIIAVTVSSVILNVPFFFAQAVKDVAVSPSLIVNPFGANHSFVDDIISNDTGTLTVAESPARPGKLRIEMTQFGQSEFYKAFTWFKIILVQILPLVFLCVANFRLFQFIHMAGHRRQQVLAGKPATDLTNRTNRQTNKRRLVGKHKQNLRNPVVNGGSSSRWQTAQRKLTVLLIVIVALFVAGQIPQAFAYVEIYNAFIRPLHNACTPLYCCRPYQIYRAVANTSCLFTYAVNFFVYLILNKHFKNQLCSWLKPLCPCCISQNGIKLSHHFRATLSSTHQQIRRDSQTLPANMFARGSLNKPDRKQHYLLSPTDYPSEAVSAPVLYCIQQELSNSRRLNGHDDRECSPLFETRGQKCHLIKREPVEYSAVRGQTCKAPLSNVNQTVHQTRLCETQAQSDQRIQHRNYLTEIQFSSDRKPFVSHSYKAFYSYDSILKKVLVERDPCLIHIPPSDREPLSTTTSVTTNEPCLPYMQPTKTYLPNYNPPIVSQMQTSLQFLANSNPITEPNCDSFSSPVIHAAPNVSDSYSSCSHLYSPLVYQESDFDVISVDECLEVDNQITNSAV